MLFPQVDIVLIKKPVGKIIDQRHIEIVAAQTAVALRGQDFKGLVVDIQNGKVERAPSEIVDGHGLGCLLFQTVGHGGRRRLVDEPRNLQTRYLRSLERGLTLDVIEIGGNGDDGFLHLSAQIILGRLFQFHQDHGRDLLRGMGLSIDYDGHASVFILADLEWINLLLLMELLEETTHQAFDRRDRAMGLGGGLALCDLADQHLAGLKKGHRGRRLGLTLGVGDDVGNFFPHHRHDRIGRSKIDADDELCSRHAFTPSRKKS